MSKLNTNTWVVYPLPVLFRMFYYIFYQCHGVIYNSLKCRDFIMIDTDHFLLVGLRFFIEREFFSRGNAKICHFISAGAENILLCNEWKVGLYKNVWFFSFDLYIKLLEKQVLAGVIIRKLRSTRSSVFLLSLFPSISSKVFLS